MQPGDDDALRTFYRRYLSERHRDASAEGCPIAADAARKDGPVGETMTRGIETFMNLLAQHYAASDSHADESATQYRNRAMVTLAMQVGGIVLSRATAHTDAQLSKHLLDAVLDGIEKAIV